MGGEVKAYGGNPGKNWSNVNGVYAIRSKKMNVSNKSGNFKSIYAEGSKAYPGNVDGKALDTILSYDNKTIKYSESESGRIVEITLAP